MIKTNGALQAMSSNLFVRFALLTLGVLFYTLFAGRSLCNGVYRWFPKFPEFICAAAAANGFQPAFVAAVIEAESGFNPRALSRAGAKGLMQISSGTARHLRMKNIWNPRENVAAGSRYLRSLAELHRGDITLAIAAYNAGPNAVKKYGGIPPYGETRAYVGKVMRLYAKYRGVIYPTLATMRRANSEQETFVAPSI